MLANWSRYSSFVTTQAINKFCNGNLAITDKLSSGSGRTQMFDPAPVQERESGNALHRSPLLLLQNLLFERATTKSRLSSSFCSPWLNKKAGKSNCSNYSFSCRCEARVGKLKLKRFKTRSSNIRHSRLFLRSRNNSCKRYLSQSICLSVSFLCGS